VDSTAAGTITSPKPATGLRAQIDRKLLYAMDLNS